MERLVQQSIGFVNDLDVSCPFEKKEQALLTKNRRCCSVKFGVFVRWSINRPGVAMRMSTLLEPPNSLSVSFPTATVLPVTHFVSRSAIS